MKHKALEIVKSKKGEPTKAILYIDDELSFINAQQIKEDILSHINEFDLLHIQANIAHLDLTGVQLVFAIRKSCETFKKQVTYNVKVNEELKNLIDKSGFKELFN